MIRVGSHLSVRIRLLIIALLPILILMPLLLGVTMQRWTARSDQILTTKVASDLTVAQQFLAHLIERTDARVEALGQSVAFRDGLARDRDAFLAQSRAQLGLDFLRLLPPIAPTATGAGLEVLSPQDLAGLDPDLPQKARIPLAGGGVEERGLIIRADTRVKDADGRDMVLSGGILLNRNEGFIDQINDLVYPAADVALARNIAASFDRGITTLFLGDTRIATTFRATTGDRAIGTRAAADVRARVLEQGKSWHDTAFVVNDWYISAYEAISDRQGARIGMIYTGIPKAPYSAARRLNATTIGMAFLGVTLLTVPLFLIWAGGIFRPLEAMGRTLSKVEDGDLGARSFAADPPPMSADEILHLARHLDRLLALLQDRDRDLRLLNADLNQRVEDRTKDLLAANRALEKATHQLVLSEKLATVGKVTAGVAHEINNPLAVTLGNIEVLRMVLGEAAHPVETELALIEEQMRRIGALANQLLQFTKPAQPVEETVATDPGPALALVEPVVRHLWGGTSTDREPDRGMVELITRSDATQSVRISPHELQQILVNLTTNAVQSMPGGGEVRLSARDETLPDGRKGVRFLVEDTGAGMDAATLARIFDPFFTTRGVRGTGLGLSICQNLVNRHGGEMSAQSLPGRGSVFSVWLPAAPGVPGA